MICSGGIADGLGPIIKDDPKTFNQNFDPPWRNLLPRLGTPRGITCMGTWRTLHLLWILQTLGAIPEHGDVSPVESRTWALRSETRCSADWATAACFHSKDMHMLFLFSELSFFLYLFCCKEFYHETVTRILFW